ncbi:hypothetical protein PENSPDRAFT_583121 [Peniophora sp. CONT]|nr:hypothetical protein PENSPDRAFT_583121 [Peniophora sp. CONT]
MLLDEGPSSPPYTLEAHEHEWSLHTNDSPPQTPTEGDHLPRLAPVAPIALAQPLGVDNPLLWNSTNAYCFGGNLLAVSLGRRFWGLRHPAYGAHGEVHGYVRLGKKLTHATKVTVSLIGKVDITATIRGARAATNMNELTIVKETLVLPNPNAGAAKPGEPAFYPTDFCFGFNLRFPEQIRTPGGCQTPPPPTYMAWSPGMTCEVSYFVKVDVVRKGMRRHEERKIPVHYLPKSWPTHAPPRELAAAGMSALKTVKLRHMWPEGVCATLAAKSDVPLILVSIPAGSSISAGHTLLIRVTIHAPCSSALPKILADGISVRLTRRTKLHLNGQIGMMREIVLGTGTALDVDLAREGYASVQLAVPVGENGREQSWGVPGMLEVLYHLRVSVQAPKEAGASAFLPVYAHDERVHVATEPYGTRQRELLSLGGASAPALGMVDRRLDRGNSVAW